MSLHWDNVVKTLEYIVKKPDNDGLCELHFTSSGFSMKGQNRAEELVSIVKAHERKEGAASDINLRLASILEEYSRKLEEKEPFGNGSVEEINLYLFTDGRWEENSSAEEQMTSIVQKPVMLRKSYTQIGIQLVGFGTDRGILAKLKRLVRCVYLTLCEGISDQALFIGIL
jgi:hypothetical protein